MSSYNFTVTVHYRKNLRGNGEDDQREYDNFIVGSLVVFPVPTEVLTCYPSTLLR